MSESLFPPSDPDRLPPGLANRRRWPWVVLVVAVVIVALVVVAVGINALRPTLSCRCTGPTRPTPTVTTTPS